MALADYSQFFRSDCEVVIPTETTPIPSVLSRWSDTNVALPAVIVVPATEDDIFAAIRFADSHQLKVVPGNGGHGSFVPINGKTLHLDMRKFNEVSLSESMGAVTVGGGASTGQVLKFCTERGYYTLTPNSNAVGMVGAFLGGGSGSFNGLHGFMIDHVISIRILTADGHPLVLDPESTGEEAALFNALCGGGHGLGVITSLTLRAFSIPDLGMDHDRLWVCKRIYPPSEIDLAAELFTSLLPPTPRLLPVLAFARAPPNSPRPGAPMIVLSVQYFGSSTDAERDAARLLEKEASQKAVVAETIHVPLTNVADTAEPFNRHGGFKEYYTSFTKNVKASAIKNAFDRWTRLGVEVQDAKAGSFVVFGSWNTTVLVDNDKAMEKAFAWRDRGIFCQATMWYNQPETREETDKAGNEILQQVRTDAAEPSSFANNMRNGIDMEEIYPSALLEKLRRVKAAWDERGVFWSPIVDGV